MSDGEKTGFSCAHSCNTGKRLRKKCMEELEVEHVLKFLLL